MPGVLAVRTLEGQRGRPTRASTSPRRRGGERGARSTTRSRAMRVEYEVLPARRDRRGRDDRDDAPRVSSGASSPNTVRRSSRGPRERPGEARGRRRGGRRSRPSTARRSRRTPRLEPHGCVASSRHRRNAHGLGSDAGHGSIRPAGLARRRSGSRESDVRVITEHMGGGFGAKFGVRRRATRSRRVRRRSSGRPVRACTTGARSTSSAGNRPDSSSA